MNRVRYRWLRAPATIKDVPAAVLTAWNPPASLGVTKVGARDPMHQAPYSGGKSGRLNYSATEGDAAELLRMHMMDNAGMGLTASHRQHSAKNVVGELSGCW
jgi:hypothetical protein